VFVTSFSENGTSISSWPLSRFCLPTRPDRQTTGNALFAGIAHRPHQIPGFSTSKSVARMAFSTTESFYIGSDKNKEIFVCVFLAAEK
jgi:hypothetical protein